MAVAPTYSAELKSNAPWASPTSAATDSVVAACMAICIARAKIYVVWRRSAAVSSGSRESLSRPGPSAPHEVQTLDDAKVDSTLHRDRPTVAVRGRRTGACEHGREPPLSRHLPKTGNAADDAWGEAVATRWRHSSELPSGSWLNDVSVRHGQHNVHSDYGHDVRCVKYRSMMCELGALIFIFISAG